VIKAKDMWNTVEQPDLEAEAFAGAADNGTAKGKAVESKINRVIDANARTVIIGYCGLEALWRILYLRTAKEQ